MGFDLGVGAPLWKRQFFFINSLTLVDFFFYHVDGPCDANFKNFYINLCSWKILRQQQSGKARHPSLALEEKGLNLLAEWTTESANGPHRW